MTAPPARVAIVIGKLDRGGTERHIAAVMPRLAQYGFKVTVFTLHAGGVLAETVRRAGTDVVEGVDARGWRALAPMAFGLARRLRAYDPDIVHFFLPEAYMLGSLCAMFAPSARRVMSRRSLNLYQRKYPGAGVLERLLHRCTAAVIGNSRAVVSQLSAEGVAPERLGLIYNGLEVPPPPDAIARSRARDALGLSADTIAGLTVGNLIPYKGHEILLQALAQLRVPGGRALVWYCVGRDDGTGEALRREATRLGVDSIVRWAGECADVSIYLHACDLAALPSLEEGFSNALLEKMAAALPIAATDVGGNAEALDACGIIVPAGDPGMLGRALQTLVDDAGREALGLAAHARVATQFPLARCVELYAELYRGLVAGTRSPIPAGARVSSP